MSSCQDLSVADEIYVLNDSMSSVDYNCINITASNVTLDCNGFEINTTLVSSIRDIYAVLAFNVTNSTIKNCKIYLDAQSTSSDLFGIAFKDNFEGSEYSAFNIADNNTVLSVSSIGAFSGIRIYSGPGSNYNEIKNNRVLGVYSFAGIELDASGYNSIHDNYLNVINSTSGNVVGIYPYLVKESVYTKNTIFSENIGIYDDISELWTNNIFLENIIVAPIWINYYSVGISNDYFNDSTKGNSYYYYNLTPVSAYQSWIGKPYASSGSLLPVNAVNFPDNWKGLGEDWHPYNKPYINMTNCSQMPSPSGIYNYNYSFFMSDEDTFFTQQTNLTFDMLSTVEIWSHSPTGLIGYFDYSGNWSNTQNAKWCITSDNPINLTSFTQYVASNYSMRSYHIFNATPMANTETVINLFGIPLSISYWTRFTMKDASYANKPNTYAQVQRFFPEANQYQTIAIYKTDDNGVFVVPLRIPDPYYRVIAVSSVDSSVLQTWSRFQIPDTYCTDVCLYTLQIMQVISGYSITNAFQTSSYCFFNSTTNVSQCSFTNTAGIPQTLNFTVKNLTDNSFACTQVLTQTSGVFTCSLGELGNNAYSVTLSQYFTDAATVIRFSDFVNWRSSFSHKLGQDGLIMGILLLMGLVLMYSYSAKLGLAAGVVGLIIITLLGFINASESGLWYNPVMLGSGISLFLLAYFMVKT